MYRSSDATDVMVLILLDMTSTHSYHVTIMSDVPLWRNHLSELDVAAQPEIWQQVTTELLPPSCGLKLGWNCDQHPRAPSLCPQHVMRICVRPKNVAVVFQYCKIQCNYDPPPSVGLPWTNIAVTCRVVVPVSPRPTGVQFVIWTPQHVTITSGYFSCSVLKHHVHVCVPVNCQSVILLKIFISSLCCQKFVVVHDQISWGFPVIHQTLNFRFHVCLIPCLLVVSARCHGDAYAASLSWHGLLDLLEEKCFHCERRVQIHVPEFESGPQGNRWGFKFCL